MKLSSIGLLIIGLIFLSACASNGETLSSNDTTSENTESSTPLLIKIENFVFHDYNGNGIQDTGEPPIEGIELTYLPENVSCNTDKSGIGIVNVPAGIYRVSINDPSQKYKFILPSTSESRKLEDGLKTTIDKSGQLLVPLAEGFLTWPFPPGTKYTRKDYLGRDSLFDRDRRIGFVEIYEPSLSNIPSGSVGVVDNHEGIDIGVDTWTEFIAAANLRITGYQRVPGQNGNTVGKILVSYENGYTGEYAHAVLINGITIGDNILRGEVFGTVEDSDTGASHLHFQINKQAEPVDPYDYWTKYRDPQYSSFISQTFSADLVNATNVVFHDYNGNGIQDTGEPPIQGIELKYEPGNYKSVTDINGKCIVSIPPGDYKVYIDDPSNKFRYILPSASEVIAIKNGLDINVISDAEVLLALGEGYLTLPFAAQTVPSFIIYVDVDSSTNFRDWKGSDGSDYVKERSYLDGHLGTDFALPENIPLVASAPGIIIEAETGWPNNIKAQDPDTGLKEDGNRLIIMHEDGLLSIYCHLNQILVVPGEKVARGQTIALSGRTGYFAPVQPAHLHFQFGDFGYNRINPYRDIMNPASVGYWTKDNDPQYPFTQDYPDSSA